MINNGETTPKRNTHSTPIRNPNIITNGDDSPEMCNRASPISNTQKNEVCWSWHSPKGNFCKIYIKKIFKKLKNRF